jgi:drug/metabolite transporter (DMT)-like permease
VTSYRSAGRPRWGAALVAGAAVLWAFIGVCTRELDELGLPAQQVGPWRALIGGACFGVQAVVVGRRRARAVPSGEVSASEAVAPTDAPSRPAPPTTGPAALRRRWAGVGAFCLVGVVVFYGALPMAVDTGGISLAYVLLYTAPIWVSLGAVAWLGESLSRAQVLGVAASVVGVAAIALSAGGTLEVSVVSVGWGLLAGLSYSSYYLLGRRLFALVDPVVLYAVVLPVGGAVLAVLVRLPAPQARMLGWLALLGVGCTWAPYLLFAMGVTRIAASRAVVVALVEPVLATVIGVAFYGERLGPLGVLGVVVVLAVSTRMAAAR